MICSKCSEVIKPVVAVDIDGTLGDYHGPFVEFAKKWLDKEYDPKWPREVDGQIVHEKPKIYKGVGEFKDWFCYYFGATEAEFSQIKLAYRQGANKRFMPIFQGAQALCWAIRDAGAELWVTTTRPHLSLDTVVPDTVEWLRRHEIEYDGMLFDDDKYSLLYERVGEDRVVSVFDDISGLVHQADLYFPGRTWLVRGEWNAISASRFVCDLDAAADIAVQAIKVWKEAHDG